MTSKLIEPPRYVLQNKETGQFLAAVMLYPRPGAGRFAGAIQQELGYTGSLDRALRVCSHERAEQMAELIRFHGGPSLGVSLGCFATPECVPAPRNCLDCRYRQRVSPFCTECLSAAELTGRYPGWAP